MQHLDLMQSLSSVGLLRDVEGLHRPQQPEYDLPFEPVTHGLTQTIPMTMTTVMTTEQQFQ